MKNYKYQSLSKQKQIIPDVKTMIPKYYKNFLFFFK